MAPINTDGTSPTGKTTVIGAVVTILGVVAIVKPKYVPVVGALRAVAPQLQEAIGVILTGVGTIITSIAHPPKWLRKLVRK